MDFNSLTDKLTVACCSFNEKGVLIACNFAWARLFCVEEKEEALKRAPEFISGENLKTLQNALNEAMYDSTAQLELPCVNANGQTIVLDINLQCESADVINGHAVEVTKYKNAMTEAITTERELTLRQRQIHDANPIPGHFWDEDYNLLDCNRATVKLFNVKNKDEFISRFYDFHPENQPNGENSIELAKQYMKEAFEKGMARFNYTHLTADGEELPIDATFVRIDGALHNGKRMLVAFAQDLRPLIKASEETVELQKQLDKAGELNKILLDAAPFAVSIWNSKYQYVDCNRQTLDLFGVDTQEEYGLRFSETMPEFQPDGRPSSQLGGELFKKTFEEGSARCECLRRNVKTGEFFPVELSMVRVTLEEDALVATYITDLRPVKEAMERENEAARRWRNVLDTMPIGANIFSEDFEMLDVNQTMLNQFGFLKKSDYLARWKETLPEFQPNGELSYKRLENVAVKVFSGEDVPPGEWQMQNAFGEPIPMEIKSVLISDRNKKLMVTYTTDLTPIHAAMAKIREEQQFNTILYDNTPHGVVIWNKDAKMIDANRQMVALYGARDLNDLLNNAYNLHKEHQPDGMHSERGFLSYLSRAFNGESVRFEWMSHTLLDEELPIETTFVPYRRGNETFVAAYIIDLRDIKATMEHLRKADERAAILIAALPIPSALVGPAPDYLIEDCNQAAINMLARVNPNKPFEYMNPQDGEGYYCDKTCKDCEHRHKQTCIVRRCLIRNWRKTINGYHENPQVIHEMIVHNCEQARENGRHVVTSNRTALMGEPLFVETTVIPVHYKDHTGFALYMRDMRETRQREIAEDESRAKTRFLARMSHEIRTPMNAVLGIAEIQLQNAEHPPATEEAFLRIHQSSKLLLSIINDILDLSKVEAGKMEILTQPYDIYDMVVETVQLNLIHQGTKKIEFALDISEELPAQMVGDEIRIRQILNNLLSNAFKYTTKGMISLSLSYEPTENNDTIMFVMKITDTGQGMTKSQLNTLFEMEFNRLNLHLNRDIQGSGLGMTITFHLVSLMNGKITVDSTPGKGSTFVVRIPQKIASMDILGDRAKELQDVENVKNSLKRITKVTRQSMSGGRVLLVDDVESNLFVAQGMLDSYKIKAEAVLSGYEAFDLVKNGKVYDIIFMDHMMPGMDGIETTKKIRDEGYDSPIVALTANILVGQEEMFLNSGFNGFIAKPIDAEKLDACLKQFINKKDDSFFVGDDFGIGSTLSDALTNSFLRDAKKTSAVLEEILAANDYDDDSLKLYVINTHALKSALANVKEPELSDIAYMLEEAGRTSDIAAIKEKTPQFLEELAEIVRKLTPDESTVDPIKEDKAFLQAKLTEIIAACDDFNKKAIKKAINALNEKAWSAETSALIMEISAAVLHTDFEAAADLAKKGIS